MEMYMDKLQQNLFAHAYYNTWKLSVPLIHHPGLPKQENSRELKNFPLQGVSFHKSTHTKHMTISTRNMYFHTSTISEDSFLVL